MTNNEKNNIHTKPNPTWFKTSLILFVFCAFFMVSTSALASETQTESLFSEKGDNEIVRESDGLIVDWEHIHNSPDKQVFMLTVESDTAQTIDPQLVLSQYTGDTTAALEDISIEYKQVQEDSKSVKQWCKSYSYEDCTTDEGGTNHSTYNVDGGYVSEPYQDISYINMQKSASQINHDNVHGAYDVNDMVLSAGEKKTYRITFDPESDFEPGTYGLFSLVINGTEFYDTTNSSDFTAKDDTEAYYSFDDDDIDGSTVVDLVGNYNGTNNGATTGISGIYKEGVDFADDGDYIEAEYPLSSTEDPFTYSLWFKTDNSDTEIVLTIGDSSTTNNINTILLDSGDLDTIIGLERTNNIVTDVNDNAYHHVVLTYDGNNEAKLYFDGTYIQDVDIGSSHVTDPTTQIGSRIKTGSSDFNGQIDELSIFGEAINQTEVDYLYASGSPTEEQQYPFESPKNESFLELELNQQQDNISILANETLNATYYDLNNTGTADMYRNGTNVSDENGTNIFLQSGLYTYEVNNTETENFSAADPVSYTVDVTESTDEPLTLFINGNESSFQTVNGDINFTVEGNNTFNLTYNVTRDGNDVTSQEGKNITLSDGTYDYKLNVDGSGYYEDYSQTITVTVEEEDTAGTTLDFSWNVDNPAPELFSCPTNPIQLSILFGAYFMVFLIIGFAVTQNNLVKPMLMFTAGLIAVILPFFFTECSMMLAMLLFFFGLVVMMMSAIVKFE